MLYSIILLIILGALIDKTSSKRRQVVAIFAFMLYSLISFIDLYYLEVCLNVSFHPSDPSNYYYETVDISLKDVFALESSNSFYFFINWVYNHIYSSTTIISLFIKFNNICLILIAYLLVTRNKSRITAIDYVLLFNPFLILTIIRNVRDVYIIVFLVLLIVSIKAFHNVRISNAYSLISLSLMSITRAILLLPLFVVSVFNSKSKKLKQAAIATSVIVLVVFYGTIMHRVIGQAISALAFIGEDTSDFIPLLNGGGSISTFITLGKRMLLGLVSMIFTPHPINFGMKWFAEMGEYGCHNIYTGIDNSLILLGSIYLYVLVLPLAFYYFTDGRKRVNKSLMLFIVMFVIIYVVAYIGVTDIRNRHLIYFLTLMGLISSDITFKEAYKLKYVLMSLLVFCGIFVLS